MSVILIATQVTLEQSKGYIKRICGNSCAAGRLGVKGWGYDAPQRKIILVSVWCRLWERIRETKRKQRTNGQDRNFRCISGNTEKGFMNHVVFTIVDANHHSEESGWMLPGNKSFRVTGNLERTK